ncbi:MAG: ferrous iron transport protein B [Prevotellaceae bacterium]|jgi:ferrous iron transport protein B|nr:ferrous iron transport protein B [Prevotellaceae bacterium]
MDKTIKLSDLENGCSAVITKVKGYGAFRKRINEMGFISGTTVRVIKKAPLQDPVEYELMGYRVSLRRSEANMIEVVSEGEAQHLSEKPFEGTLSCDVAARKARSEQKKIDVALVGNPNSGKTTFFNYATGKHEHVGNYGGVTVGMKTARLHHYGYTINVTDLPGTYSMSEYTPEELYVRRHLSETMPDVVINVVDASNLERNLFLTTQLIDMNIKVVLALNMYDELEKKGDTLDYKTLGKLIGIPIVPLVAAKGKGIGELLDKVVDLYEENDSDFRHIHINYGEKLNTAIDRIREEINQNKVVKDRYHAHYVAIKLLENDKEFFKDIAPLDTSGKIAACANRQIESIEKDYKEHSSAVITDAKYAFIRGALKETFVPSSEKINIKKYGIDSLLTHRWLGFPIFLFFMWAMFQLTFTLGAYPQEWIEKGFSLLGEWAQNTIPDGALRDLLVDGVVGGVGGVFVFLPNIIILFFCISLMEDTGYMARAAFIMDRLMHSIGLHGKSFIPLLMGFGCNVPAIMATRTLENRKDRLLTMIIIPFMSCSARLPVYLLMVGAFFTAWQGLVLTSIYAVGIVLAILTALVLKRTFKEKDVPFVMELPPYRIPTVRNTTVHMWSKSVQYLRKMGTVILCASIAVWALGYFPRDARFSRDFDGIITKIESNPAFSQEEKEAQINALQVVQESERMEQSYIGRLGHFIEPAIRPLGYDWKIGVSLLTGMGAKEIVVSTMGVLYQSSLSADESSAGLQTKLQQQTFTRGAKIGQKVFTPLTAYTLMLFVLIYFPCIAAVAAIKKEGGWRWAFFSVIYSTALAWIVAFLVYRIGSMF